MPHDATATSQSPTDLAVIARAPLLDDLAEALQTHGIRVERPLPEETAWEAFLHGAVLCVLAPDVAETAAHGWQTLADRAAQLLPISVAALPETRRHEQGDWLAAGFDDVLIGSFDAGERAIRLRGRMRSRGVRHSLSSRDPLTGLPTQQVFFSRLDPTIRLTALVGGVVGDRIGLAVAGSVQVGRIQAAARRLAVGRGDHEHEHLARAHCG